MKHDDKQGKEAKRAEGASWSRGRIVRLAYEGKKRFRGSKHTRRESSALRGGVAVVTAKKVSLESFESELHKILRRKL